MAFLWTNKSIIGIIALLLVATGVFAYVRVLQSQLSACSAEKSALDAQLSVSIASVKSLQIAIDEQNASIEQFKNDADQRQQRNQAELAAALNSAAANKRKADDILHKKPPPNVSDCEAASRLLNEAILDAKK